jgi:hypothetical protein
MIQYCAAHGRTKVPWFEFRAHDQVIDEFTCNLQTLDKLKHGLSRLRAEVAEHPQQCPVSL